MEDLNFTRESEKHGLDYYLEDYDFVDFEKTVAATIEVLEEKLNSLSNDINKAMDEATDLNEYNSALYLSKDIYSVEEELFLIYELIILNDYKEFEIILKKLLKASLKLDFPGLHRIDVLKTELKNKKIDITKLENYKGVNDLREVNNAIKHSSLINRSESLKKIPEFKVNSNFNYIDLKNFHRRIFKLRISFIFELKKKIYNHLYRFDEKRITNFAKTIIRRLDSKHTDLLIAKLEGLK